MNDISDFFIAQYRETPALDIILEAIAFVCGIASVYLAKKQRVALYPVGLIATALTAYLLYKAGYYGEVLVNAYFTIMSFYGWYHWTRGSGTDDLPVSRANLRQKFIGTGIFIATFFVIYAIYRAFDYPIGPENYLDIFCSGIFFTAMWFMALKKIENWTLWIAGNLLVLPLYAIRGLGMLTIQYAIFTILAVTAYLEWKKILQHQTSPKPTE